MALGDNFEFSSWDSLRGGGGSEPATGFGDGGGNPNAEPSTPFRPGPPPDPSGPTSNIGGIGKYIRGGPGDRNPFNRNLSGNQFRNRVNGPAVLDGVRRAIEGYSDAKYFYSQGMGAATRHLLGMKQRPSHRADDINARRNAAMQGQQPGINPGSWIGGISGESPEEFNVRHFGSTAEKEHWGV